MSVHLFSTKNVVIGDVCCCCCCCSWCFANVFDFEKLGSQFCALVKDERFCSAISRTHPSPCCLRLYSCRITQNIRMSICYRRRRPHSDSMLISHIRFFQCGGRGWYAWIDQSNCTLNEERKTKYESFWRKYYGSDTRNKVERRHRRCHCCHRSLPNIGLMLSRQWRL